MIRARLREKVVGWRVRNAIGTAIMATLLHLSLRASEAAWQGRIMQMSGDESAPVKVWDAKGEAVLAPYYAFDRQGLALWNHDYGLRLEGGYFYGGGTEEYLAESLKGGSGITLAARIIPAQIETATCGLILAYAAPKGEALVALLQEGTALYLQVKTADGSSKRIEFTKLKELTPFHLAIALSKDATVAYRDGKPLYLSEGINFETAKWPQGIPFFGNLADGKLPWRGEVELFSLYNQALDAEAVAKVAQEVSAEVADRPLAARIELEGELLARPSEYPKPWTEGFTYPEVLAVSDYKVNRVIKGDFKEERIYVVEWMYVDRIFLEDSRAPIGTKRHLLVESLDVNPQLSRTERAEPAERDFDRDLYYSLSPIAAIPAEQQPKPPTTEAGNR